MLCNNCWTDLQDQGVYATCGHIFCVDCTKSILTARENCPRCDGAMTKAQLTLVNLEIGESKAKTLMIGLPPSTCMKSAAAGNQFWLDQVELEKQRLDQARKHAERNVMAVYQKSKEKMDELVGVVRQYRDQAENMAREREAMMKDHTELQQKYAEKSRQKRKLEEMYEAVKGELESVRRSTGQGYSQRYGAPLALPGQSHDPYGVAPPLKVARGLPPTAQGPVLSGGYRSRPSNSMEGTYGQGLGIQSNLRQSPISRIFHSPSTRPRKSADFGAGGTFGL